MILAVLATMIKISVNIVTRATDLFRINVCLVRIKNVALVMTIHQFALTAKWDMDSMKIKFALNAFTAVVHIVLQLISNVHHVTWEKE